MIEPVFVPGLDLLAEPDGVGNSLPQALFLSYKSHGQFSVDRIKHKVRARSAPKAVAFDDDDIQNDARRALDDFNAALDRDPSDAELWRKTARVAAFLRSTRISRFSLEAAIELDDDPALEEVEPPSLAEGFAGEQLREQLAVLGDEMALSHPIMKPYCERGLPQYLEPYVDPIPFLPNPAKSLSVQKRQEDGTIVLTTLLKLPSRSWAELGTAIVNLVSEKGLSGEIVSIELPEREADEDIQMEVDKQLQLAASSPPPDGPVEDITAEPAEADKSDEVEAATSDPAEAVLSSDPPTREDRASRKRSQSVAGLPDVQEEDNGEMKRSKRTRRRETAIEEVMDPATLLATQIQPFQAADQNLFQTTKDLLENMGVTDGVTLSRIAEILESCTSEDRMAKIQNLATNDLRDAIVHFDEDIANILLSERESTQISLSAFLEHSKSGPQRSPEAPPFDDARGLAGFVEEINANPQTIDEVIYAYLRDMSKTYTKFKWSETTKASVLQVIDQLDEAIWERIVDANIDLSELVDMIFMLYELHLEIYERTTNPNSVADPVSRVKAKGRVDNWLSLATRIKQMTEHDAKDPLTLRYLWAVVQTTSLAHDAPRDHIITCWHSLRDCLAESLDGDVALPNNQAMPEISVAAAEREISKLTTMDFFLGLFQDDTSDPVSVIDTLEPVLNPESVCVETAEANGASDVVKDKHGRSSIKDCASQWLRDLWKFLQNSSTDMRLLLWARLGEAYGKIKYTTKQFSCFLRSIETVIGDFERDDYANTPAEVRRALFMTNLKALDDLIIQSLHLAINDNSSFDIIDEDHLQSTLSVLAKVSCLLHAAAMYEDEVRIGMTQPASKSPTYTSFMTKLSDMQVRTWSLQYTVLKVGIHQHANLFPRAENDLADYLQAVHQVLGLRKCCKGSNKIFLKMMRIELLKQRNIEGWEDYLGQVLYDLHGLKLGVGIWEVQDHGCPAETLERRQAIALVDKMTILANRMTMKDLLKSDLKTTIEHMQQAIGSTKSSPQMILNLRNFSEYMRTPIHPLHLYQALTGNINLDAVAINTPPESTLAERGWFFLQGMIALTKFKGVDLNRRQTPGATDDLRIGTAFLRQQLQFTPDRWDAWFRLAECFDYELDEAVLWTADKMNKDRAELVKMQRSAIHSYTLALSHSYAWASDPYAWTASEEDEDALYDMYHEFGMRLYASSREPFAMEPFQHSDHERFCIETMGFGTFKRILHEQMSDYQVWKFAAHLFRKAMVGKPRDWKNPYMVAKCLWKMHQKPLDQLDEKNRLKRPTAGDVVAALEKTVEVVSALPKPRHGQDPILEPHYKIVSVVHKLVVRGELAAQNAADILQRQPYAPDRGETIVISNPEDWEAYVIKALRHLRDKDKSNWQHRLVMGHARILFDENDTEGEAGGYLAAKAAFAVMRENMFTKTMVMNVWKCDAERSGRHHVYTERYVRFMVKLLAVMNDRVNLEMVLRRIRKKGVDFYHFTELWQSCVLTYIKLLRQTFAISPTDEDVFKGLSPDDFEDVAEKVTEWAATPTAETHKAMGAMKEAVELKKLNANLMKAGPIDDLVNDCYAAIYLDLKPGLSVPEAARSADTSRPRDDDEPKKHHELLVLGSLRAASEQPDKPTSHAGDPAPRGRRPGVRKLDVIRKAEQAVLRAAEGPARAKTGGRSSSRTRTPREEEEEEDVEMEDAGGAASKAEAGEGDENGSEASSPPGSVHDSADDESDLSDVPADYEDDVPASLMFPNLRRSVDVAVESTDEESEEGEEEEEEAASAGQAEAEVVGEVEAAGEEEEEEGEGEDLESEEGDEEGDEVEGGADVTAEGHEGPEGEEGDTTVAEEGDEEEGEEEEEEEGEEGDDEDDEEEDEEEDDPSRMDETGADHEDDEVE